MEDGKSYGHDYSQKLSMEGGSCRLTKILATARKRSLRRLCFHRCLSVHRGPGGVSVQRGVCLGGLCPEGSLSRGCLSGGVSVWGVSVQGDPPYGWLCAGGTHPTGMDSCVGNKSWPIPSNLNAKPSFYDSIPNIDSTKVKSRNCATIISHACMPFCR